MLPLEQQDAIQERNKFLNHLYGYNINEDEVLLSYIRKSMRGNLLNYYMKLDGINSHNFKRKNSLKQCKSCGKFIVIKTNSQKYCEDCRYTIKLKQNNESKKRIRMKVENNKKVEKVLE